MRNEHAGHRAIIEQKTSVQKEGAARVAGAARERLALIEGAIREIQSRPELSCEAKQRGVRALERARERALRSLGGE